MTLPSRSSGIPPTPCVRCGNHHTGKCRRSNRHAVRLEDGTFVGFVQEAPEDAQSRQQGADVIELATRREARP